MAPLAVCRGGTLWLVNPDNGQVIREFDVTIPTYSQRFFVHTEGTGIVYGREADLWFLDTGIDRTFPITDTPDRWELMPSPSPACVNLPGLDGCRWLVAFTSRPLRPEEQGRAEPTMFGPFGGALTIAIQACDVRPEECGAGYRVLEEGMTQWPPTWSPDGRLAYGMNGEIHLYDLTTDSITVLDPSDYGLKEGLRLDAPAWAPDGDRLAVFFSSRLEEGTPAEQGYVLIDLNQRTSLGLIHWEGPYAPLGPALWSPAGDAVLLNIVSALRLSPPSDVLGLWWVPLAKERPVRLPMAYDVDWSPDGQRIAYIDNGDRQVYVVDPHQPADRRRLELPAVTLEHGGAEGLAWRRPRPRLVPAPTATPPTGTPEAAGPSDIRSYHATVEEFSHDPVGDARWRIERWYQAPDQFRQEVDKLEGPPSAASDRTFVQNGDTAWLYIPAENRVVISLADPTFGQPEQVPPGTVYEGFEVTILGNDIIAGRGARGLQLEPKDPETANERRIWYDRETRMVLVQEEYAPDGTLLQAERVLEVQFNVDLPAEFFTFEPPAGAEVDDQR